MLHKYLEGFENLPDIFYSAKHAERTPQLAAGIGNFKVLLLYGSVQPPKFTIQPPETPLGAFLLRGDFSFTILWAENTPLACGHPPIFP